MLGLLPCAGTASRLFNIPKFMLPTKKEQASLLIYWIHLLRKNHCDKIIIGVSDYTKLFVEHSLLHNLEDDIRNMICVKFVGNTKTMNETLLECVKDETYEMALMGMPDTYVTSLSPTLLENCKKDDGLVGCYLWNIRDTQSGKIGQCKVDDYSIVDIVDKDSTCQYTYGWGVVVFKPGFEKYMYKDDLHIGYSMKRYLEINKIKYQILNDGLYFDCGTTLGYTEYLNHLEPSKPTYIKGTIIVIAVYINNNLNNYNILVSCLQQARQVYPYNIIVAVDNGSLNNNWYQVARDLNITILYNDSVLHRFEMGAYRLALQNFRADNYIFMQGTVYLRRKFDLSVLNQNEERAMAFSTFNGLNLDNQGLMLVNNLLKAINMKDWNNEPLVLWNSFCCNNLFLTKMMDNGIFDLPSNTKAHSCVFERILGSYLKRKQTDILSIGGVASEDNEMFRKICLCQDPVTFPTLF